VATFFMIVGLLLLTAFVFVVWLCVQISGLIFRAIFGPPRNAAAAAPSLSKGWMSCRNLGCRATNPEHARFCARCGQATGAMPMRYVA
jgi:hypothetical protein